MCSENDIDNELMSVFGNIILQFREERNLSQEQAAEICHIPLGQWVNLENSSVWPQKNTMIKVCRELHFSQKDFFDRFVQFTDQVIAKHKKFNRN